jgi:hypothetical protein
MTAVDLQRAYITKANDCERRANERKAQIEREVEADLREKWNANKAFYKNRVWEHELTHLVNSACSKDPLWKGAAADNRWYIEKAIMYGAAATTELLQQLLELLV